MDEEGRILQRGHAADLLDRAERIGRLGKSSDPPTWIGQALQVVHGLIQSRSGSERGAASGDHTRGVRNALTNLVESEPYAFLGGLQTPRPLDTVFRAALTVLTFGQSLISQSRLPWARAGDRLDELGVAFVGPRPSIRGLLVARRFLSAAALEATEPDLLPFLGRAAPRSFCRRPSSECR